VKFHTQVLSANEDISDHCAALWIDRDEDSHSKDSHPKGTNKFLRLGSILRTNLFKNPETEKLCWGNSDGNRRNDKISMGSKLYTQNTLPTMFYALQAVTNWLEGCNPHSDLKKKFPI
jgi:hypothetical protein